MSTPYIARYYLALGLQGHSVSALRDLPGNQSGVSSKEGWELGAEGWAQTLPGAAWAALEGEGVASEV